MNCHIDVRLLSASVTASKNSNDLYDLVTAPFIRIASTVDPSFRVDSDALDAGDGRKRQSTTTTMNLLWKQQVLADIPVDPAYPTMTVQLWNKDVIVGDSKIAESACPVAVFAADDSVVCGVPQSLLVELSGSDDDGDGLSVSVKFRVIADDFGAPAAEDDGPVVCRSRSRSPARGTDVVVTAEETAEAAAPKLDEEREAEPAPEQHQEQPAEQQKDRDDNTKVEVPQKDEEQPKEQPQQEEQEPPQPKPIASPTRIDVRIDGADVTNMFPHRQESLLPLSPDDDGQDLFVRIVSIGTRRSGSGTSKVRREIGRTTIADVVAAKRPRSGGARFVVKWAESIRHHVDTGSDNEIVLTSLRFDLVSSDLISGDKLAGSAEVALDDAMTQKKNLALALVAGNAAVATLTIGICVHTTESDSELPAILRPTKFAPLEPSALPSPSQAAVVVSEQTTTTTIINNKQEEQEDDKHVAVDRSLYLQHSLPDDEFDILIDSEQHAHRGCINSAEHASRRDIEQRWSADSAFRSFLLREWHHHCRVQQKEKEEEMRREREREAQERRRRMLTKRRSTTPESKKSAMVAQPAKSQTLTASPKSLLRYQKQQAEMKRLRSEVFASGRQKKTNDGAAARGSGIAAARRGGDADDNDKKQARDHYDDSMSSDVVSELKKMIDAM